MAQLDELTPILMGWSSLKNEWDDKKYYSIEKDYIEELMTSVCRLKALQTEIEDYYRKINVNDTEDYYE